MGLKQDKRTATIIEQVRQVAEETGLAGQWVALAEELNGREIFTSRGVPWRPTNLAQFCQRTGLIPDTDQPDTSRETQIPAAGGPEQVSLVSDIDDTMGIPNHVTEEDLPTGEGPPMVGEHPPLEEPPTEHEPPIPQSTTVIPPERASEPVTGEPVESRDEPAVPPHTMSIPELDAETVAVLQEVATWWKSRQEQGEPIEVTRADREERPLRTEFPGPKTNTGIRINKRLLEAVQKKMRRPEERPRSGGKLSYLIEMLLWGYLDHDPKFQR